MSIITKGYGVASRIITKGYGVVTTAPSVLLAVARKFFKTEREVYFRRDSIDSYARRIVVDSYCYAEAQVFERREAMDTYVHARKQDER